MNPLRPFPGYLLDVVRDRVGERIKRSGIYRRVLQALQGGVADQAALHRFVSELRLQVSGAGQAPVVPVNRIGEFSWIEPGSCADRSAVQGRQPKAVFGVGWRGRVASTAGTSGRPLMFYQSYLALQAEQAFIDFIWSQQGFYPAVRLAVLRGGAYAAATVCSGNRLLLSANDWSVAGVAARVDALNRFQPEFIHCYPSILWGLLRRATDLELKIGFRPRAVFCGSEALSPLCADGITRGLGCAIVAWYGQSEQAILGVRKSDGGYRLLPAYSGIEFLKSGSLIEMVGTSYLNPEAGFVRYRTGDFCSSPRWAWDPDLRMAVLEVDVLSGRNPEFIETDQGQPMPFNQAIFGVHDGAWAGVSRFCFVHTRVGEIALYFECGAADAPLVADRLRQTFAPRMPKAVHLRLIHFRPRQDTRRSKWSFFMRNPPEGEVLGEYFE